MEELEKFFKCPYCHQRISMLLDVSVTGHQRYIEDCEVCCRPIEVEFESDGESLLSFRRSATQADF